MCGRPLRPGVYEYGSTGADDEITAEENVAAWRRLRLRPRVLRDVSAIDTSVTDDLSRWHCRTVRRHRIGVRPSSF